MDFYFQGKSPREAFDAMHNRHFSSFHGPQIVGEIYELYSEAGVKKTFKIENN